MLLEWTYLVIAVAGVVIAGILALFNQSLGLAVLIVPFVAFIAASMNVVAWALIKLMGDAVAEKPAAKTKRK